ncbi:hypothetical protein SAMN06265222_1473, partial [Neorhodopirellula lusitana]
TQATYHKAGVGGRNCIAPPCFQASDWFSRITIRISGRWRATCKDGQSGDHHRSVASIGYSPSWNTSIAAGNSFGDSACRSAHQRVRNRASDRSLAIANLGEVENVGNPVELVRRLTGAAVEKAASEVVKTLTPASKRKQLIIKQAPEAENAEHRRASRQVIGSVE